MPLELLGLVSEDLGFETTDDEYHFMYDGYEKKLYKTLKKYYNISFTGFDTEDDLTITMNASVDQKTFNVKEMKIKVIGENIKGKVIVSIDSEFDNFNTIEKIELPEED